MTPVGAISGVDAAAQSRRSVASDETKTRCRRRAIPAVMRYLTVRRYPHRSPPRTGGSGHGVAGSFSAHAATHAA